MKETKVVQSLAGLACLLTFSDTPAQPAVEAWVQRYSNLADSSDYARKVVTDNAGNVIVAGYSDDGVNGADFLIIKYSGVGVPLWTNRYNGPGNGDDAAWAVAVDGSGNVFVTGNSLGSGSSYDYATIKYSGAGVPLWTNRYNGPGNDYDLARALAVDGSGNVFVTGWSYGIGSHYDYATIKYSGAGVPLWTNRYNGPGNSDDQANAIAVDGSGNVFVTGTSVGSFSYDYATIKYSGAGVPLWTNRYSGPGNFGDDQAYALAVDGGGNALVTGSSGGDYGTIKYSGQGMPLWTNYYNGPGNGTDQATAMAVDGSGNVFVTGFSYAASSYDYATIKYSGAGVPLWTNLYGLANESAQANAVAADGSGDVFVTGFSYGAISADYVTIKYSGAGVPLWTNHYDGPGNRYVQATAVAVDRNSNVFVTGYSYGTDSDYDYATVAYSGAGAPLWTNRYNWPGNADDHPVAAVVDGGGNVFVTGYSYGDVFGNPDYATIKYSEAGVPLWTNRYNGPGIGSDQPTALAVDGSGNVIVTGYSIGSGSSADYATIKYSGDGTPLWTNHYDGPGNRYDQATAVAVDRNSNVFVTGYSYGTDSDYDYATIKYSGAGVPLWTNRYNGPQNYVDKAAALAVDANGDVFVTGTSVGSFSYDYATIKYSGAGVPLWTNYYDASVGGNDAATAIAVDASGNVFVTGNSSHGINDDYATVAYSSAGVPLWTNRYNGPGDGDDRATGVAVDSGGNVFVTGYSLASGSSYDYATIRYSGLGVPLWTNRYNGPGNYDDRATAVAVDGNKNVFVTGYSAASSSYPYNYDYVTIAYSGAGVPLWTNRYNGPANGDDSPTSACLAIAPDGAIYVTGSSDGNYSDRTTYDYVTIKYSISVLQPIPLNYQVVGDLLVVAWTNAAFSLQSSPSVQGAYTNVSGATSPYTNALSAPQQYFRLKGN